ncbi:MAG: L,D-transpeptidase [Desulfobaccales bacterium]
MIRKVWLVLMVLLLAAVADAAPDAAPPLYQQLAGGETEIHVEKGMTIGRMAARNGVRWATVVRQNHLKKPFKLNPGMVIKINNIHIVPAELKSGNGLVINLPELNMYHFQSGVCQRRYALAVGKPSWPTPTGTYKIEEKRKNPIWNVPPSIQEEMEEMGMEVVEKVPPGPKNPLGKFFMATSASGVGIHATNRPWSVGSYVSHGCIRMLPDEISQLFPQVEVGTPIKIIYRPIKMALTPEGRVYLEANPNIYQWELQPLDWVKSMAEYYQIEDHIDWSKVPAILKVKDGIAHDITKDANAPPPAGSPKEVQLSPLHGKAAKLE